MIVHFIRHSKPDYSIFKDEDPISILDLAGLSQEGIEIVENFDINEIKNSEIIMASPYARTMQTASIISRRTGIKIITDYNLHEWIPDKTYQSKDKDFYKYNKMYYENPNKTDSIYETESEVRKRLEDCILKYKEKYSEIIIVAHQRLILTYTGVKLDYCELVNKNI
jgi:broad specificity phosphatase PhoE